MPPNTLHGKIANICTDTSRILCNSRNMAFSFFIFHLSKKKQTLTNKICYDFDGMKMLYEIVDVH